jgi:hypothetical protein
MERIVLTHVEKLELQNESLKRKLEDIRSIASVCSTSDIDYAISCLTRKGVECFEKFGNVNVMVNGMHLELSTEQVEALAYSERLLDESLNSNQ